MREGFVNRIRFLSICILVVAFILVAKLYHVQIVQGSTFVERAERQYMSPGKSLFDRGSIYFSTKDESLIAGATLKSGYIVSLNPKILQNPQDAYNKISEIIPLNKDAFFAKANKKDDPYEEIAKRVEPEAGEKIAALKIPGVSIYKDRWRFYPGAQSASHTLGFISFGKNDVLGGQYGLERAYEDILGRSTENVYVNFFAEIFSNIDTKIIKGRELEGDIVVTIEPTVQSYLEQTLAQVNTKYGSEMTGGVIMNPKTGEIYAMAVTPTFDSNNFQKEKSSNIFSNPLVENVYEMGSIVKPLTVASGIDAKAITAKTTFEDRGFLQVNGATIYNFDKKARGVVDMQAVLNNSLNTGVSFIVSKMGKEKFSEYMYKLGVAELTNIDLPNEGTPLAENLKSPRDIEHFTASFGQGIAVTPISMTRSLAALANGGVIVKPHLVKKINYKIGIAKDIAPDEVRRVFKPETSEEISRMLVNVVDKALVNGEIKNDHYSVAAKTGTAQMAKTDGSGYYDDRYLHSFFGYFPAFDAKFIVFLYTVHPKGVDYASQTLAYPFADIEKFLINYYQVPPDR
jgi:cell division protein FtsI/penicillin-binding protein 2